MYNFLVKLARFYSFSDPAGKPDLPTDVSFSHIHATDSYDSSNTVFAILDWAANATDLDISLHTALASLPGIFSESHFPPRHGRAGLGHLVPESEIGPCFPVLVRSSVTDFVIGDKRSPSSCFLKNPSQRRTVETSGL